MIDEQGLRANVGIILINKKRQVFWGRRIRSQNAWQFPQGGMHRGETTVDAMYRELEEELGLSPEAVDIIAESEHWLTYLLPKQFIRHDSKPLCIGQKQRWFLLELLEPDSAIVLDHAAKPEFAQWYWVDYWHPVEEVIEFKREVYQQVLSEFESLVMP